MSTMNLLKPEKVFALIILSLLILSGCGSVSSEAFFAGLDEDPGSGSYIPGVPVIEQTEKTCGPAALAMVMGFYSSKAPGIDEVTRWVYTEKLGGTLSLDLLIYAKEKGFHAEYYRGGLDDLREKISGGKPLIIFLNLGLESVPMGHYVVAVGYNDRLGAVLVHGGRKAPEVMTYENLKRAWSKNGYSTLLVYSPLIVAPPQEPVRPLAEGKR